MQRKGLAVRRLRLVHPAVPIADEAEHVPRHRAALTRGGQPFERGTRIREPASHRLRQCMPDQRSGVARRHAQHDVERGRRASAVAGVVPGVAEIRGGETIRGVEFDRARERGNRCVGLIEARERETKIVMCQREARRARDRVAQVRQRVGNTIELRECIPEVARCDRVVGPHPHQRDERIGGRREIAGLQVERAEIVQPRGIRRLAA